MRHARAKLGNRPRKTWWAREELLECPVPVCQTSAPQCGDTYNINNSSVHCCCAADIATLASPVATKASLG